MESGKVSYSIGSRWTYMDQKDAFLDILKDVVSYGRRCKNSSFKSETVEDVNIVLLNLEQCSKRKKVLQE